MSERTYYCLCENDCRFETMTKEQILAAITEAVETHAITDVNTGFVTTLKERNANAGLKFWVGTTAQYNAIEEPESNCFYILTDDGIKDDIFERLVSLGYSVDHAGETAASCEARLETMGEQIWNGDITEQSATADKIITASAGSLCGAHLLAFEVATELTESGYPTIEKSAVMLAFNRTVNNVPTGEDTTAPGECYAATVTQFINAIGFVALKVAFKAYSDSNGDHIELITARSQEIGEVTENFIHVLSVHRVI